MLGTRLGTGRHPVVRWLLAVCLVATGAYLVSVIPGVRAVPGYSRLWEIAVYDTAFFAAALTCLARGVLVAQARAAWSTLGSGMLLYATGTLHFSLVTQNLADPPYPSLSDGLWLSLYPCVFAAIVLLVRATADQFHASLWLDGLVAGFGGAAVSAAFAFDRIVSGAEGSFAALVTNFAYPAADLLTLVLAMAAITVVGRRAGAGWWLLVGGLVLFTSADTWFLVQIADGSYRPGSAVDATWAVGAACLALAASRPTVEKTATPHTGWSVLGVPALFALVALGVLVHGAGARLTPLAVVLAAASLVAAFARTGLTFREVLALADSRRQARTDDLTALPNRRALIEVITDRADREAPTSLMLIDLVRFKEVNDLLGYGAGDEVLRLVAGRLTAHVEEGQMLARLGDDEFAFVLPDVTDGSARETAERILGVFDDPYEVAGLRMYLDARVGVALAAGGGATRLLANADLALARAKEQPDHLHVLAADEEGAGDALLRTASELRDALQHGELVLHYQPQVDLGDSYRCVGVEALVRWQHPTQGLLGPDAFLPVAERAGLMPRLSLQVLRQALAQAAAWRAQGLDLVVAVNLSPTNLLDADLPAQVRTLLAQHRLAPDAVELEITEQVLFSDRQRSVDVLNELRSLGIRLALDDFGTGFSSMTHLQTLPVDVLKIDLSFVRRLLTDARAEAIVSSTIDLSHALGLRVVGEGVEDAEALARLEALGCDLVQGWYFGRPMSAGDLEEWLSARQSPAADARRVPSMVADPSTRSPA